MVPIHPISNWCCTTVRDCVPSRSAYQSLYCVAVCTYCIVSIVCVVVLSVWSGVAGCGWPISARMFRILTTLSFAFRIISHFSFSRTALATTMWRSVDKVSSLMLRCVGCCSPFFGCELIKKCPLPALLTLCFGFIQIPCVWMNVEDQSCRWRYIVFGRNNRYNVRPLHQLEWHMLPYLRPKQCFTY
jgi:hypothetical protein